jgi:hypothetical protein
MPNVTIENLSDNCQVTVIITELVDIDDPNPPAEQPEGEERDNVWLVSKTSNQGEG